MVVGEWVGDAFAKSGRGWYLVLYEGVVVVFNLVVLILGE